MSSAPQTAARVSEFLAHRDAEIGRVLFKNPGLIDKLAITTFGLSAKIGSNPHGRFGTGIKHAIAMILRAGESITIWRGLERLDFDTVTHTVRDKSFQMVRMNGEEIGFTLNLGAHWEPWMAFRELWCNCQDEAGAAIWMDSDYEPEPDVTAIEVRGDKFATLYADRHRYILESKPLFTFDGIEVHDGESKTIFHKGIAVKQFEKEMTSLYTYNILSNVDLTEDRTLRYDWQPERLIADGIQKSQDREFIERCLEAPRSTFEAGINFKWHGDVWSQKPNQVFMDVVRERRAKRETGGSFNATAIEHAERHTPAPTYKETALPIQHRPMWHKLIGFLGGAGFDLKGFKFGFYESLGAGAFASATGDKYIMVAVDAFDAGERRLAESVIEEMVLALKRQHREDIDMETFCVREIIRVAEHFMGPTLQDPPPIVPDSLKAAHSEDEEIPF